MRSAIKHNLYCFFREKSQALLEKVKTRHNGSLKGLTQHQILQEVTVLIPTIVTKKKKTKTTAAIQKAVPVVHNSVETSKSNASPALVTPWAVSSHENKKEYEVKPFWISSAQNSKCYYRKNKE